jgi:hypothetical protein
MEGNGDKKSTHICLDISSLFFHTVPILFQALVIMYDEIFQALAVEGYVLLPKPFLDLGFDGVFRCKPLASETFLQFAKHVEVRGCQVRAMPW